jgi:hypothetical protein
MPALSRRLRRRPKVRKRGPDWEPHERTGVSACRRVCREAAIDHNQGALALG